MDGRALLAGLEEGSAALVFFDPQFRGLLDELNYGNEGARQSRRHALQAMPDSVIAEFVGAIARVLKPRGHLMLWTDKYALGTGRHLQWFDDATKLKIVDVIVWDKGRIGQGYRSRSRTEFLLVVQKKPTRAKGVWCSHDIADICLEAADRELHPHAKPLALQQALIRAVTKRGDLVVDPAAGSYSALTAARFCGREFLGCDLAEDPRGAS